MEKYYVPEGFEVTISVPTFVSHTEDFIKADVEGSFITERVGQGNTNVEWFAKKVDFKNPLYNDTVQHRLVCISNVS